MDHRKGVSGRGVTKEEWRRALEARQGEALCRRLEQASAAVCGLGGLGSNIALALARTGIGRLILIDFDRVELSNIHRQNYKLSQIGMLKTEACAENISEAAPFCRLTLHNERLSLENAGRLLSGAEAVCEALDCAETKAMLADYVAEYMPEVFFAAASGMAGLAPGNLIRTRALGGHWVLCGDETSEVSELKSLFAPRVMLCAAAEALAVTRFLAGEDRN